MGFVTVSEDLFFFKVFLRLTPEIGILGGFKYIAVGRTNSPYLLTKGERPMGISRFNSEGYYDPTAHEAVSNMEKEARKWRPLVYICSPYSGDVDRNTEKARRYCRFAVDQGAIPLAAHLLLPQFMSETRERDLALFMDMVLMGKCEQVWVFGKKISSGMASEIAKAKKRNMTIRYFTEQCKEIS